jgi:hypothetical protein
VVNTRGHKIKKAGENSEKETWLNCKFQPFSRHFFEEISSLQLLAANDWKIISFL